MGLLQPVTRLKPKLLIPTLIYYVFQMALSLTDQAERARPASAASRSTILLKPIVMWLLIATHRHLNVVRVSMHLAEICATA